MQKVFDNPAELEKLAKERFSIPPFLMMENAARSMADFILNKNPESVLIICGKGNNGGDGYALARMICDKTDVLVVSVEPPSATEAITQYEIASKLGVKIKNQLPQNLNVDIIVDCLYGIGFHGDLSDDIKSLLHKINSCSALKIACDIPSGLYFNADYTISMGEQKTILYSDKAKAVCGKILISNLGIPQEIFENCSPCNTFLIEKTDLILPKRTNKSAHKGTYGHTTVFAGEKAGAAIIAATSAMNGGSGLTTLLKTDFSNLEQFKISPELMLSDSIPAKTSCISIGSGLGDNVMNNSTALSLFLNWCKTAKNPACVIDADLFHYPKLKELLQELNSINNIKIILTPHLKEFQDLCTLVYGAEGTKISKDKISAGKKFVTDFQNVTLVIKSSNTFIFSEKNIYIVADGGPCLAKGGSGDVLAGLAAALLAQGYSTKDAAITACELHALAATSLGADSFSLTPEKLITAITHCFY